MTLAGSARVLGVRVWLVVATFVKRKRCRLALILMSSDASLPDPLVQSVTQVGTEAPVTVVPDNCQDPDPPKETSSQGEKGTERRCFRE